MPDRTRDPRHDATVDAWLARLAHPRLAEIHALRQLVLDVDPAIGEAVKWNAPSFHVGGDHFATMRLAGRTPALQLILHLGARNTRTVPRGAIADPQALLTWLGHDRACIDLMARGPVATLREPLQALLRRWLALVAPAA